jgi:hypothetical protein
MHDTHPSFCHGQFVACFFQLVSRAALQRLWRQAHPHSRRARQLPPVFCLLALVCHALRREGTLRQHVLEWFGIEIAAAALAQRRARLPWAVFPRLLALALPPLAQRRRHAGAFDHGRRLVGLDGTPWSVRNTPRLLGRLSQAASRRLQAALAKIGLVVLVELGRHNPLAAAIGQEGESAVALARRAGQGLPEKSLLLGERL